MIPLALWKNSVCSHQDLCCWTSLEFETLSQIGTSISGLKYFVIFKASVLDADARMSNT